MDEQLTDRSVQLLDVSAAGLLELFQLQNDQALADPPISLLHERSMRHSDLLRDFARTRNLPCPTWPAP